ncbi:SixA phosphatase family protein [Zooshikella harenae]|uniref:Histidine phosphatase family protein n=1 Tax=Zooshikella harenae TaxID=2827238 RepID=A0ABS5ZEI1_9GAMM|nr:histidine phosphatase family protein [Zooshikella harenae]MBU2712478.1 histidine phosphatase family protein [Zooshikella harenae]
MKELILLRHAKSSWKDSTLEDFDRPLNKRGKTVAPQMGQVLADVGWIPQYIIASPAKRCRSTTKHLLPYFKIKPKKVQWEEMIYEAPTSALYTVISEVPDTITSLMVIGHNPGLEMLATELDSAFPGHLTTCAAVCIDLPINHWRNIGPDVGKIRECLRPKDVLKQDQRS